MFAWFRIPTFVISWTMTNNSDRKITDLPPELALYICKHIADRDILNTVEGIPTWKWIASSDWFRVHLSRRICHWQWIDRFIHRCLIPQPSSDVFRDPRAALEYRIKQDELYAAKSFIPENLSTKPRVRMIAYPLPHKHGETVFQQVSSSFAYSPTCHM